MTHSYEGNIRELRSILLRALFFRTGNIITGDQIRRAMQGGLANHESKPAVALTGQLATEILASIAGGADFWSAVYEPYSASRISRDVVRLVVEAAREAAGRGMPQVARFLKAVTGDITGDPEERRRFFKFKNFLYKTVKI